MSLACNLYALAVQELRSLGAENSEALVSDGLVTS